jgi:hypothetical protein
MPFGGGVQHLGIKHADNVPQVEIALGQFGHVLTADFAQVAFIAFGHRRRSLG